MKRQNSLQWKLVAMVVVAVMVACVSISFFISQSAIRSMDKIETTVITAFPIGETTIESENVAVYFDTAQLLKDTIQQSQQTFWFKSMAITCVISGLIGISLYLIIGKVLKPLHLFSDKLSSIDVTKLDEKLAINDNSVEISRLMDSFNGLLYRLHGSFRTQKQFAANAAHELRTPIAIIQTKLDILGKKETIDISDYKDMIRMVQNQITRLSQVIDVLLEMTRVQSAPLNDTIEIKDVIEEVFCDLQQLANEHSVTLIQHKGNGIIKGNDTLVYRAIYNLVENAIKYNRHEGNVSVDVNEENQFVTVLIHDCGYGIAVEKWNKIFESFYRIDKSRSRKMGGAGLGLALVKDIAKLHDGNVEVINSNQNGTTIALTLRKQSN